MENKWFADKQRILNNLMRAFVEGKSYIEKKPLYIGLNTFGIPLEASIYRIFEAQFLLEDLEKSRLTLTHIDPKELADSLENPLLGHRFIDESGDVITLSGILKNYYGSYWSCNEAATVDDWEDFTHGSVGIRIKVRVHTLMDRICNTENRFFSLQYHLARVQYYEESEIEAWPKQTHYTAFLDSLGHNMTMTLQVLRKNFSHENEVRLTYFHQADGVENPFLSKVKIERTEDGPILCRHPFDWSNVVEDAVFDSNVPKEQLKTFRDRFCLLGLPITT